MSSRRIGTFDNLSPIQEISINPFSELNSDNINKLTKCISNGEDGVIFGLDVINPNLDNEPISHYEIIKNSEYCIDNTKRTWEYDTEHCNIEETLPPNHINKITIYDITKCSSQTVNLKVPLNSLNLLNFKGENIQAKATFTFHIISGCPKRIYAHVNSYSNYIEYPDTSVNNKHTIDVVYNFIDNKSELNLLLVFVLDPSDTYSDHVMREPEYNGQSFVEINNISYSFSIVNSKSISCISRSNYTDNYPTPYIHPTHVLSVTAGIAIKDNAVIDVKGRNKKYSIPLTLDLNDNRSWIKNNPYTLNDFDDGGGTQKGFVYNKIELENPYELNSGSIDISTKYLCFRQNGIVLNPKDKYESCLNDYQINFNIDSNGINIPQQTIISDIYMIYGNVGYIYNKDTNKIIQKINLKYNSNTRILLSQQILFEDIHYVQEELTTDKIGIVLSAGPIKVSGKSSEINSKMIQWGYVVMYYTYYKNPKPNKAYIGLIRDTDLKDLRFKEDYLILAKVRFITPNTVDIISYEDRQYIYHYPFRSSDISYDIDLTPEERNYWIDPNGITDVPTTITDAITKLIQWIPEWSKGGGGGGKLPLGNKGEILFNKGEYDAEYGLIMYNGIYNSNSITNIKHNCYVVDNDEDFELCKNVIADNGYDVNKFTKFAHTCNNSNVDNENDYIPYQYGISPVYVNATVTNEINTFFEHCFSENNFYCLSNVDHNGHAGYISKKKYTQYDVSIRCFGTESITHNGITYESIDPSDIYQQDSFGIVASFVTDSNGNQHTLTFMRSGGDSEYTDGGANSKFWTLDIDRDMIFRIAEPGVFRDSTTVLCDNSLNVPNSVPGTDSFKPWLRCGDGALIHVKREGNIFTAWTSKRIVNGSYNKTDPNSGDIYEIEKSKIILNLNDFTISTYNGTEFQSTTITDQRALNLLRLFKDKSSSWGFSKVGYTNVAQIEFLKCPEMENGVDLLIHKDRQEVWIHDFYGWKLTDYNDIKTMGPGKFSWNSITKKLFWNDNVNIIRLNIGSYKEIETLESVYPIGSVYIGTQSICPFEGVFGTWVKISQGKCLWGATNDNNPAPGTELAAGLPDITGEISSIDNVKYSGGYWNDTPNGAFKRVESKGNTAGGESDNNKQDNDVFEFKASYSNSIYGNSNTVQPPAFVVNIWQRTS